MDRFEKGQPLADPEVINAASTSKISLNLMLDKVASTKRQIPGIVLPSPSKAPVQMSFLPGLRTSPSNSSTCVIPDESPEVVRMEADNPNIVKRSLVRGKKKRIQRNA